MTDEQKIIWILAFASKAVRGEISTDCASFAEKAVDEYLEWLNRNYD